MFKIGDKVEIIKDECCHGLRIGTIVTLKSKYSGYSDRWNQDGNGSYVTDEDIQLIDNNNNMDIKEKFLLAFKSEPEKTFRKAGITGANDFLTEDGQKVFLSWLLKKNGEAFKSEVVDELVKDEKSK